MIYIAFNGGKDIPGGGGSGEVPAYWNTSNTTSSWTFSDENKRARADTPFTGGAGIASVLGEMARSTGKRYFEIYINDLDGNFNVSVRHDFGVTRSNPVPGGDTGASEGAGYRRSGHIFVEATNVGTVTQLGNGEVVSVAIDLDSGSVWFARNGTWTQGDPSTGSSPEGTVTTGVDYFPFVSTESPINTDATLRIQSAEFSYSIPTGFLQWGTA